MTCQSLTRIFKTYQSHEDWNGKSNLFQVWQLLINWDSWVYYGMRQDDVVNMKYQVERWACNTGGGWEVRSLASHFYNSFSGSKTSPVLSDLTGRQCYSCVNWEENEYFPQTNLHCDRPHCPPLPPSALPVQSQPHRPPRHHRQLPPALLPPGWGRDHGSSQMSQAN